MLVRLDQTLVSSRINWAPPVPHQNVDLINTVTFGSFGNWNNDRVEEERKRRASFQPITNKQHHALQEKKKAPNNDKENRGDGISLLLHNSAGTRDPPAKSDKQGRLNVSSPPKEDTIKTTTLLPTPTTSPLKALGFTNGSHHKILQILSFNSSSNSEPLAGILPMDSELWVDPRLVNFRVEKFNNEDIMESAILDQWFSGGGIPGPAGPSVEVNQAGAFDRPVQMEPRARSRQMHPAVAGRLRGFYGHFRC